MPRNWTARKSTTLNEAALHPEQFARAFPVFRAGPPDPTTAPRQALGLVVAFAGLVMPVHVGVCWLAAAAGPLAAVIGLAAVLTLLGVALARWLGLDDVLRKLPLVLVFLLLGYGLWLFLSPPSPRPGWGGAEVFGTFFLVVAAASILGSFYQPLSAAYRSVTQNTSASQLVAAAAALALSVGLALLSQAVPQFALQWAAAVGVGLYAGVVLFEYAAWAKANPTLSLEHVRAFSPPSKREPDPDLVTLSARQGRRVLVEAAVFGCSLGVFGVATGGLVTPSAELTKFLASLDGDTPHNPVETLTLFVLIGAVGLVYGVVTTSLALHGFRPPKHPTSFLLAWKPLVVFLTYPDTRHPLAHRLRFQWLRPPAVRIGLTVAVMLLAATADLRTSRPPSAPPVSAAGTPSQPQPPRPVERAGERDRFADAIVGFTPDETPRPLFLPLPPPPPDAATKTAPANEPGVVDSATSVLLAVLVPPAVVYLMVCLLGVLILPAYHAHFEKPAAAAPTA